MKYNQDKSAFPSDATDFEGREYGLTRREYFAAMAMQGIMANPNCEPVTTEHFKNITSDALNIADTLLEELEK